jgi:hypothetical protein
MLDLYGCAYLFVCVCVRVCVRVCVVLCVQDIGLFSVFRGMCHSLWLLWELAITGQPILVQGQHPELVSDTVLSIVGLISPICFAGDFRPYFSLYDPDFKEVCCITRLLVFSFMTSIGQQDVRPAAWLAHLFPRFPCVHRQLCDCSKRGEFVSTLIVGSTNPFFTKCFEQWPNAVWICPSVSSDGPESGGAGAASPVPASPVRVSSAPSGSTDTKVRPKVLAKTTSLTSVLPSPGDEGKAKPCVACRAEPLVPPDNTVLGQLLAIRAEDELGKPWRNLLQGKVDSSHTLAHSFC